MAHVEINTTGKGRGTFHMDGRKLHAITAFTVSGKAGEIDTVTLDLVALDGTDYEGEAKVRVRDEVAEVLIQLGWTPPKDQ